MTDRIDVAVVGGGTLVGEALLSLLAEREFPVGTIHALDVAERAGTRAEFRDGYLKVQDIAAFDFTRARLAFFCADEKIAAAHAPRAAAAGCVVIDDSAHFRGDETVPLVVPSVNPQAIAGYARRGIIANPNTCAAMLAMVLKPLHDAARVTRVTVTTLQSVSGSGRAGIDELGVQTASLLNMKGVVSKVYPKQIAFNVLPRIGDLLDNGYTHEEMKIVTETRKILADESLRVSVTCVRVPVFYGHALTAQIETEREIDAAAVRAMLARAPEVKVLDGREPGAYPTAVTDAAGEDVMYVGRVREDISHPPGLVLWAVADNVRTGAALNCIQTAEILVKSLLPRQ